MAENEFKPDPLQSNFTPEDPGAQRLSVHEGQPSAGAEPLIGGPVSGGQEFESNAVEVSEESETTDVVEAVDNRPHAEVPAFPDGTFAKDEPAVPDAPDESGRVQDKEKAVDMAYAGKPLRDDANKDHLRAEKLQNLADSIVVPEKPAEYDVEPDVYRQQEEKINYQKLARRAQQSAEGANKFADVIEKWAGMLHDHPISEAYQERHPGVKLGPTELATFEMDNTLTTNQIQQLEAHLETIKGLACLDASIRGENFSDLLEQMGAEYEEKWEQMRNDPATTVGQIEEFYKLCAKTVVVDPMQNTIALRKIILDDVESGRAAA